MYTFDDFIADTNGRTIGEGECWDYVNLIWTALGSRYWTYPPSNPSATNHGIKWGVLNAEALEANQIYGVTFISDINQVKRSDIVITTGGEFGHGGFMNEDFDPLHPDRAYNLYSQNYNNRRSVALDSYRISNQFAGAFRYDAWWIQKKKEKKFPWVLNARRLRGQ